MQYIYNTIGTCSSQIIIDYDGNTIQKVAYIGGCNGNLQGIGKLVEGQKIDDIIAKLSGIKCGYKITSCPDQLARALKEIKQLQTN